MVKTVKKTGKKTSPSQLTAALYPPPQLTAALNRLDESEKFQASIVTRLELIEKHIETISGRVNSIAPAVGDNTTHTAQLDTIALTTAKDIEEIKSWMNTRMKDVCVSEPIIKDQDTAKLVGILKTVSQKVEQLSDRIIRIERKFLLGKDIVLPKKEADQAILKSVTATENKVDVHGKRLTSQAADIRMVQDSLRSLSVTVDAIQIAITALAEPTITTSQSTSSQQPQS